MFFLILLLASDLGDLLDFEIFRQETIFRTLGIIFSFPLTLYQYLKMNQRFLEIP